MQGHSRRDSDFDTESRAHITVQTQQSHSSSPQSHPKHGFEMVLIGFLTDPPELVDGRVELIGARIEATDMTGSSSWRLEQEGDWFDWPRVSLIFRYKPEEKPY